ncbi:hypothetical protein ACIGPN_31355 [Streptomyces afghaniensis]|uniref:hypothetical protein n=1 Tax=Streptomyces TaxID=1883 RepID=UPI0012B6A1BE|nr:MULTISPECIES: hypothetical protein [Streptomyces]UOB11382.1 hypothetical protein MQE23_20925 [Streptomyces sp. HP-A2021]
MGRLKLALLVPIVAVLTATAAVGASPVTGDHVGQVSASGQEDASVRLDNTWGP